jgi:hypothetical protein
MTGLEEWLSLRRRSPRGERRRGTEFGLRLTATFLFLTSDF